MKLLVVIAGLVALTAGNVIPQEELPPKDNSHYVQGKSRYVWMDIHGQDEPLLVDLEEPVDEEFIARNGANNEYRLFTRGHPSHQTLINGNTNSIHNSNYNGGSPTMVIVHGWNNNGNSPMNHQIRDHFLSVHPGGNVIVVDWGALASSSYTTAAAGAPSVGQHLGNFLAFLFRTAGGNWNNLHLVGFSLGAHIVGVAGRNTGATVGRCTGLDPAGPGWQSNNNRLDPRCGSHVEAIHTDRVLGIGSVVGHADFFPNGGQVQPGCGALNSPCSHGRAPELFASTITSNRFTGRQCSNVSQANSGSCTGGTLNMGNAVLNKRGSGIYHVTTGSSFPF